MKSYLRDKLSRGLEALGLTGAPRVTFEEPRTPEHGDLTTNIAMVLAKHARTNPRQLAQRIVDATEIDASLVDRVEVAGPGFINFHFADKFYLQQLKEILRLGKDFGSLAAG